MSIKNLRARAAAALRRSSTASVEVKRQTKVPQATGAAAQAPQWRIESLEPKLLLSADALPAAHLLVAADKTPTDAVP